MYMQREQCVYFKQANLLKSCKESVIIIVDQRSLCSIKMTVQRLSLLLVLALSFIGQISAGVVLPSPAPPSQHPQCPLWYHYYDTSTQNCTCLPDWLLHCDRDGNAFLDYRNNILSYDSTKEILSRRVTGNFQILLWTQEYNFTQPGQMLLPKRISELNDYMCTPMHRKGYLCRECADGFGPSVVSAYLGNVCCDCSKTPTWYGVTLYLSLEFIPLTLFFLFLFVFRIRVTSAPMICFIMYSQLVSLAFHISVGNDRLLSQVKLTKNGTLRSISKIFLTLYGVFNLEFFHHAVNPFCISSQLTSIHIALLGYVSAFYPFLLIVLIWIGIELHDRNYRPVVIVWKPFRRCIVRLRKQWDTRRDITDVFGSFFVLSYTKIMYQTLAVLSADEIYNFSLPFEPSPHSSYVLSADSSISVGSAKYVCIFIFAGLIFCVFNIFPALLLTLSPFQWFRSLLSWCRLNTIAINHFIVKFHHSYRDGVGGGKDMRSFSGLHLLLRIIIIALVLLLRSIFRFEVWFLRAIILSSTGLVVALCRPYKQMHTNVLDSSLMFYLATFCHLLSSNQDHEMSYFVPIMQVLILAPFVVFVIIIFVRLIWEIYRSWRSQKPLLTSSARVSYAAQPMAAYGTINN